MDTVNRVSSVRLVLAFAITFTLAGCGAYARAHYGYGHARATEADFARDRYACAHETAYMPFTSNLTPLRACLEARGYRVVPKDDGGRFPLVD